MEKKVLVILTRPPVGRIHVIEGVRIAVGLTLEEHEVKLLFTGDSIFSIRKEFQIKEKLLFKHMEDFDGSILVERDAMMDRGILQTDLVDGMVFLDANDISNTVEESDHVITF